MSPTPSRGLPLLIFLAGLPSLLASSHPAQAAEDLPPPPIAGSQAPLLPPEPPSADLSRPAAPPEPEASLPAPATSSGETTSAETPPPETSSGETSRLNDQGTAPTDNSPGRKARDFQGIQPQWAISLDFAPVALGGSDIAFIQAGVPTRGFSVSGEFQPGFLQNFGVIGFGPSFGLYPMIGTLITLSSAVDSTSPTPTNFSNWFLGFQVRYQARFFREQLVVPDASFLVQSINYGFIDGSQGRVTALGPAIGAMLLLNTLDPDAAADFYFNHGVTRSYFTVDARFLTASDAVVNFSGLSLFFGLRIEL